MQLNKILNSNETLKYKLMLSVIDKLYGIGNASVQSNQQVIGETCVKNKFQREKLWFLTHYIF